MALTNVAQVLDVIDALDALAVAVAAIPVDLTELLEDIAAAKVQLNDRIGDAIFPADAAESLVVVRNGTEFRFSRRTGRLEPVVAVPAGDVPLADVATGGTIVADGPSEQPPFSPTDRPEPSP